MKKLFVFALSIFLILIFVPTISLSVLENNNVKDPIEDEILNESSYEITVYDVNKGTTFKIEMEEYLKGVVASEMPAEFNIEALKAQAVTARTYLLYKLKKYPDGNPDHPEAAICSGIHCQVWHSLDSLKKSHSSDWYEVYWDKICEAVDSTKGEILVYDNKIIEPLFHSTSGGRTENSEDVFSSAVPYLRSVESPYEHDAPKLHSSVKLPVVDFISILKKNFGELDITASNLDNKLSLLNVSEGGKVITIKVDTVEVSGRDIRSIFNLNSTNFRFVQSGNDIEILTTGYGHGVGMSQWGANGMAENGSSYEEILNHYYTDVDITTFNQ